MAVQFWGVADSTKEHRKQWGLYSFLLAMKRDPAEFGWHWWSNTPTLPHIPQLTSLHRCHLPYCPYHRVTYIRAPVATADANQNCFTIIRHSFLFLARSLAPPHIHPPIIQGSLYSIHPPKPRPPCSTFPINFGIRYLFQQSFIIHPLHMT